MNVLSLFDGMSCGQIALERAGIKVDRYFASEIKSCAIKVTKDNYPNTIHIGDVNKIKWGDLPKIDLVIAGSPCQDFSFASPGNMTGLDGERSGLMRKFFEAVKILKPSYFLLENVRMKKEQKEEIENILGVKAVFIDSADFSFQNRKRLYWTNINIEPFEDRGINFQDFIDTDPNYCAEFKLNKTPSRIKMWEGKCPNVTLRNKVNCLTVKQDRWGNSGLVEFKDFCRYLTTRELELAQTVPVGYTRCLSKNQAQNVLGDGWTIDVIAHIFKGLKV